jgi:hypothetical protein
MAILEAVNSLPTLGGETPPGHPQPGYPPSALASVMQRADFEPFSRPFVETALRDVQPFEGEHLDCVRRP